MVTQTPLVARLQVLGAALLFSTGGAAIKGTTLTAWQVAGARSLIAAVALMIVLPQARRHWRARSWLIGLVYALTLVTFVTANKLTTAANAIFLQSTAPLYILLIAPWALRERVRAEDVVFMLAMASGLALFFVGEQPAARTAPNPFAGNVIATLSGVVWAFTVMGLRWVGSRDPAATLNTVVIGNLWAFVICLPSAWPMTDVTSIDWAVLLWLGVFQIGLAYVLLSKGVTQVTALEASLLLLAEPVLNPIWAWAIHGETVAAWSIAGGAIILGATAVRTTRGAAGH
jgi:drug/metabolite transporter, DME family